MRIHTLLAGAAIAASLAGCYTYPAYPAYHPAPIARLTPEQSAAIAGNQSLSQADRDRLTRDNAQVAQQDAYAYSTPVAPSYYAAPPAAYYVDPFFYGGYPYYGGYYGGFYPGITLGFGFRGGYGGFRGGYGGGFHGGGFHGGHR